MSGSKCQITLTTLLDNWNLDLLTHHIQYHTKENRLNITKYVKMNIYKP
jgi:hypothetical protein